MNLVEQAREQAALAAFAGQWGMLVAVVVAAAAAWWLAGRM